MVRKEHTIGVTGRLEKKTRRYDIQWTVIRVQAEKIVRFLA